MRPSLEVAIISLADATERRERIMQWMAPSPYPWRFFDACRTPPKGDPQYDGKRALALHGAELRAGEIGCFASHFRLLKEFEEADRCRWLLVVEDDVLVDLGFPFAKFLTIADRTGLKYFKLYTRYVVRCRKVGETIVGRSIVRFHGSLFDLPGRPSLPLGTQGYVISREGASSFIRSVDAIVRPVDWQFDRYWENGLGSYIVFPHPLIELVYETTITRARRRAPPSLEGWLRYNSSRLVDRLRRRIHDHRLRPRDIAIARAISNLKAEPAEAAAIEGPGSDISELAPATRMNAMRTPDSREGHRR